MPIRFYDNNDVTYSPYFVARDSNKEIRHNDHFYRKVGVVNESRSIFWSIGQVFKGLSFGVMGVATLPLALCCRTTSQSCFKSFVKSLHQAWRREEIVKVYVRQHFFQEPVILQENHFPVNPLMNPVSTQNSPRQNSRPAQNQRPSQPETPPARPLPIPAQLSFSLDEQTIEVVMKVMERRFEYAKNEWERGNREGLENFMRETFDLAYEWFDRAPANYDRPLAYARLLRGLDKPDLVGEGDRLAHNVYSRLLEERPEDLEVKKEFVKFALEGDGIRRRGGLVYPQVEEILKQEPNNIEMRVIYGDLLFNIYEFREAVEQYRQVLILDPNCVEALMGFAKCLMYQDDPIQAYIEFEKAIAIAPEMSMLRYEYAKGLIQGGLEEKAVEQYQKALELNPCNIQIRADYLHLLMNQGSFNEIIRICEEGFTLPIDPIRFDDIYCEVLAERKETEKLEHYCQRRLEEQPDATGIRRIYAQFLLEKGDHEGACQQYYAILEEEPDNFDALETYFKTLRLLGRGEEIRSYHQRRVDAGFNEAKGQLTYACALVELGKLEEAEVEFCILLKQIPRHDFRRESIEQGYFEVLKGSGQGEKVEQFMRRAIQDDPNDFKLHEQLADFLQGQGRLDEAILVLDTFITNSPDHILACQKLMQILEDARKHEELKQFYEKYLERNPNDCHTRRRYGDLLRSLNDLEGAAEHYKLALELDFHSYYFDSYFNLLRLIGKAEEIPLFYERVLENNPSNQQVLSGYAKYLAQEGKFGEAAEQYEKLLQLNDGNLINGGNLIKEGLAGVLVELGRMEEAAEYYEQAINSHPSYFSSPNKYFKLLTDLNRTAEVGVNYGILIESGQEYLRKNYALWLKDQNQLVEAAEQFKKVFEASPYYFDSSPYLEVLDALNLFDDIEQYFLQVNQNADDLIEARLKYGNYLKERNRVAEAEVQLRLCVEADGRSSYVRDNYLAILQEQGKADRIDQFYLEMIEKFKNDEDQEGKVEFHLAYIGFLRSQGKSNEVVRECLRMTTLYPLVEKVWTSLNDHFEEMERLKELECHYRTILTRESSNVAARLGYAEYLRREGKTGEAEQQLKESLKIDSKNISARRAYVAFLDLECRYDDAIKVCEAGLEQNLNDQDSNLMELRADYAKALANNGHKSDAVEQYRILIDQGHFYYQWRIDRLLET